MRMERKKKKRKSKRNKKENETSMVQKRKKERRTSARKMFAVATDERLSHGAAIFGTRFLSPDGWLENRRMEEGGKYTG